MKICKKLTGLVLLALMISFTACQEEELNQNDINNQDIMETKSQEEPDVQVINGTLHFKDVVTYEKILNELGEMTNSERELWEKELGFYSLESHLESIYKLMDEAQTENEFIRIIDANKDFFKIENETVEEIIPYIYQRTIDKNGIFYIGSIINKVRENDIIRSKDGKISTLNEVISGNIDVEKNEDVLISKYIVESTDNAPKLACGYSEECSYRTSKRKVYGKVYVHNRTYFSGRYIQVVIFSNSYKKSWGKWRLYKTSHSRKDIQYDIQIPTGLPYPLSYMWYYIDEPNLISTSSDTKTWTRYKSWQVDYSYTSTPYLYNIGAKFSTRGVGNNWAVINCM